MGSKTNNMGTHKINEVANMKRKFHLMLLWNLTARWNFPITQLRESLPVGREVTRRWHSINNFPLEEPVISLSSSENLTGLQWRVRVYETLLHFLSGKSHTVLQSASNVPVMPLCCCLSLVFPICHPLFFLEQASWLFLGHFTSSSPPIVFVSHTWLVSGFHPPLHSG